MRVATLNRVAETVLGYTSSELMQAQLTYHETYNERGKFLPPFWKIIAPSGWSTVIHAFSRNLLQGSDAMHYSTMPFICKNGRIVHGRCFVVIQNFVVDEPGRLSAWFWRSVFDIEFIQ